MGVTRSALVSLVATGAACGFNPEGEGHGTDDGLAIDAPDTDDGDGPAELDAAPIDARVIDAPDLDARLPCPVEYNVSTLHGNYSFRVVAAQHAVASADCADDLAGRTHLATFENEAAYDGDIAAVNPGDTAVPYVGGVCSAIDCAITTNWFWSTGSAIDPIIWKADQPNNGATQLVTVAEQVDGTWVLNNTEAFQTRPYICECDP